MPMKQFSHRASRSAARAILIGECKKRAARVKRIFLRRKAIKNRRAEAAVTARELASYARAEVIRVGLSLTRFISLICVKWYWK